MAHVKVIVDLSQPKGQRESIVSLTAEEIAERDAMASQAAIDAANAGSENFVSATTSRALALTDAEKIIEASGTVTLTVPTDESVAFPIGTTITVVQVATGTITIDVADAGTTTLNYTPSNVLRDVWSTAVLVKRAANTWLLSGDLL